MAELKKWVTNLSVEATTPLFPNRYGDSISRFCIKQRLDCAVNKALASCPSLKGRKISPHSIRNITAMHMLRETE
jgi:integrase/recombinase XerD